MASQTWERPSVFPSLVSWHVAAGVITLAAHCVYKQSNDAFMPSTDQNAAASSSPSAPIPVAHSAQLTIEATRTDDALALHIARASDHAPIRSNDVNVSIDGGKSMSLSAQPDGSYLISDKDLSGSAQRTLDIIVGHDGIREVLTGTVSVPDTSSATSLLQDHKQMAWWVLNVAIVLVAAILLSRRKPSSSSED